MIDVNEEAVAGAGTHCLYLHFRKERGKVVYRVWDPTQECYLEPRMSRDALDTFLLYDMLTRALEIADAENELVFRNLTSCDWWTKRNRPIGRVEEPTAAPRPSEIAMQTEKERMALIASVAITAYRNYVRSGGDPNFLPSLSFKDGKFDVALRDKNGNAPREPQGKK